MIRNVEGVRGDISHETEPNKFLTKTADSLHYSSFSSFFFFFFPPFTTSPLPSFSSRPSYPSLLFSPTHDTPRYRKYEGSPFEVKPSRDKIYLNIRLYITFVKYSKYSRRIKCHKNNTVKVSGIISFSLAF